VFEYICNGAVAKWSKAEASKASFVGSNPAGASRNHPDSVKEIKTPEIPEGRPIGSDDDFDMPLVY
jgi:hypothetical protein